MSQESTHGHITSNRTRTSLTLEYQRRQAAFRFRFHENSRQVHLLKFVLEKAVLGRAYISEATRLTIHQRPRVENVVVALFAATEEPLIVSKTQDPPNQNYKAWIQPQRSPPPPHLADDLHSQQLSEEKVADELHVGKHPLCREGSRGSEFRVKASGVFLTMASCRKV